MFNVYNSKVTVELDELIRSGVKVWDFEYPSYYEGVKKLEFEQKVLDHYRFRQIGCETVGRWLHEFRSRVREIMPYYIQLYKSVELFESVEDPLESYNLTETYKRETSSSGTSSSSGTTSEDASTDRERRFSDTPRGTIANLDTHMSEASRENEDHATETASSGESESSTEGVEEYTLIRRGNIGVQPFGQEIKILRDSFINVDREIINELNDLFLLIY